MSRRLVREGVFKALFQVDVGGIEPGSALRYALQDLILTEEEVDFAGDFFRNIILISNEIDSIIEKNLVNWELKRIASVDRCLLRMAAYELLYMPEIPPAVSINEALELGKKYSDPESVSFINGLLDKLTQQSREQE